MSSYCVHTHKQVSVEAPLEIYMCTNRCISNCKLVVPTLQGPNDKSYEDKEWDFSIINVSTL